MPIQQRRTKLFIALGFVFMIGVMSPPAHSAVYSVTDYQGRTLRLQKPAQRIIALAPHIVENLFSAGLGDKIVGTVEHTDFPETAKNLPRIGSASGISLEQITALQPDLVITWTGGGHEKIQRRLIQLGFNIYADNPNTLKDIARSITDFATLGDTQNTAKKNITAFYETLAALKHTRQNRPPISVFYQMGHQPFRTLNGQHWVSDVITLCGGRNIFAKENGIAPIISLEALIVADPAVIIAGTKDFDALSPPPRWLSLPSLWATRHRQYYAINPDWLHRPTLRTALGARALCHYLRKSSPKPN